jgi:hypothetical protein
MKKEVYIAMHKHYPIPNAAGYVPIHVGKVNSNLNLSVLGDDTGDNISHLNKSFCELTALYWMWKNSDADVLGLVHYRRYFFDLNENDILSIENLNLKDNEIYLIKPNRFIKKTKKILGLYTKNTYFTVQEQFENSHGIDKWTKLRAVIQSETPEYILAFDKVSCSTKGVSFYNMFIMNKLLLDEYCTWLFRILFACQKIFDLSEYDDYQSRLFGFFSERLLNVFVYHKKLAVKYYQLKNVEETN